MNDLDDMVVAEEQEALSIFDARHVTIRLEPLDTYVLAQFLSWAGLGDVGGVSRMFLMDFALTVVRHTDEAQGLVRDAQPQDLFVSEADILSLLESVPATATVGETPVGLTLQRKLCEALLRYHPEHAVELPQRNEADERGEAPEERPNRLTTPEREVAA